MVEAAPRFRVGGGLMRRSRGVRMDWLRVRSLSAKLAIGLIAGSALFFLTRSDLLVLIPGLVLERGAIWELLTYAFVASDPLGVIFGALVVWSIGSALEASWGPKRLLWVVLGCTVLAAVLTVLTALPVSNIRSIRYSGAWVMGTIIWVGYGLSYGRGRTNFWGIPVTGNVFALIGIGFVLLQALFIHDLLPLLPEVFGIALVAGYLKLGSPRLWLLRFQSWRFQRQFRARSKHLRVITKDRNTSRDSDRYLH
jgi:membrane associated rhomboid family serine protease